LWGKPFQLGHGVTEKIGLALRPLHLGAMRRDRARARAPAAR
jgi:hypothetical protein